jgi:hypothetical protein
MDEFVTEIQSNINITSEDGKKKSHRLRELLSKIISSNAEIRIIDSCDNDGDIVFEVPMKSIGITYDTLLEYREEVSSEFAANFIGELMVRENIDKFAKLMINLKDEYSGRVNNFIHRKFGMKIYRDKFILRFHLSLIQNILTEDFRKKMIE